MAPRLLIALALAGCGGGRREEAAEPEPIENLYVAGAVVIDPCTDRDGLIGRLEACPAIQARIRLLERRVEELKGLESRPCAEEAAALRELVLETGCP